jgi:AbrB family looped-hinge helix DNA binding protein
MPRKKKDDGCCTSMDRDSACCKVDAIITVDERGQMVLPKDVRKKANIKPGDKFALVCMQEGGKVCCISLIKVDELTKMVEERLGPIMGEIVQKEKRRSQK